jgi:hypothetical protein
MLVPITMDANEKSLYLFMGHQHGGDDVTWKPRIATCTTALLFQDKLQGKSYRVLVYGNIPVGCARLVMGNWNLRSQQTMFPVPVPTTNQQWHGSTTNDVIKPAIEDIITSESHGLSVSAIDCLYVRSNVKVHFRSSFQVKHFGMGYCI